eukprot:gene9610-6757_t
MKGCASSEIELLGYNQQKGRLCSIILMLLLIGGVESNPGPVTALLELLLEKSTTAKVEQSILARIETEQAAQRLLLLQLQRSIDALTQVVMGPRDTPVDHPRTWAQVVAASLPAPQQRNAPLGANGAHKRTAPLSTKETQEQFVPKKALQHAKGARGARPQQSGNGAKANKAPQSAKGAQGARRQQSGKGAKANKAPQSANGAQRAQPQHSGKGAYSPSTPRSEKGAQGAKPLQHATGAQATKAPQNMKGAQGAKPQQGEKGATAPSTPRSEKGAQGARPQQRATGAQATKAPQNVKGAQGAKPQQGGKGATAPSTPRSEKGAQGARPQQRATGAQATKAPQNVKGAQGAKPQQGGKGATAPRTPRSEKGAQGALPQQRATGAKNATAPQSEKEAQGVKPPRSAKGAPASKTPQATAFTKPRRPVKVCLGFVKSLLRLIDTDQPVEFRRLANRAMGLAQAFPASKFAALAPPAFWKKLKWTRAFERLTALRERLTSPSPQPAPSAPLAPATSDVEKVVASITGATEALGSTLAEGTRKVLQEVQAGSGQGTDSLGGAACSYSMERCALRAGLRHLLSLLPPDVSLLSLCGGGGSFLPPPAATAFRNDYLSTLAQTV